MRLRRDKNGQARPGTRRLERLLASAALNKRWPAIIRREKKKKAQERRFNPVGLRQKTYLRNMREVRSAHGAKVLRTRRAKNRVAHESRRRNYARSR